MKDFIHKKGFTLVEALIAILILLVAIVAPMQIASKGIATAIYSKNKLIAQYLAQDAAEYILARKAANEISATSDWLDGLDACRLKGNSGHACTIDTIHYLVSDAVKGCDTTNSTSCVPLNLDNSTGLYS